MILQTIISIKSLPCVIRTASSVALVYEDYMQMNWNSGKHDSDKVIGLQFELKGFYTINVHGIDNPSSTNTHYIPSTDPVNLNR